MDFEDDFVAVGEFRGVEIDGISEVAGGEERPELGIVV